MTHTQGVVVVTGAGLQGSCIALELARLGIRVVLMDQDEYPMNRASLRNEGKIHLGLIYANDPSFTTARLQLTGALRFRRLLARWLGSTGAEIERSTPFTYLVARDSVLSPDQLAEHYERVETAYREQCELDPELDYLGMRPTSLVQRLKRVPAAFSPDAFSCAFATAELAIDTHQLARRVRVAIQNAPLIEFRPNHRVQSISCRPSGMRLEGEGPQGAFSLDCAQVVNATWERRHAFDHALGLPKQDGLLHRLKYRVLVRVPSQLEHGPSATMVLGRYGDVVIRPGGLTYLSWYPTGLRGWSDELEPPRSWDDACRGEPEQGLAREVGELALRHIDAWYPGIAQSEIAMIDAGAIVAVGRTDVDDARSGLHDRTQVGLTSLEDYHSVCPGKLTTAPLFALQAAQHVARRAGLAMAVEDEHPWLEAVGT